MNVTQSWKIVKDTIIVAIKSDILKVKIRSEKTHPLWMNNDRKAKIKKKRHRHIKGICKFVMTQTICIIPQSEIKQKHVAEQQ